MSTNLNTANNEFPGLKLCKIGTDKSGMLVYESKQYNNLNTPTVEMLPN